MTTPGVPADRLTALRRAFDAMTKDPAYIAETDKLQLEVDSLPGEQLQELIAGVMKTPSAVIERAKSVLK
jgi:tripartite-type tricarboxylate transporter receptor subunit TctC